MKNFWKRLSKYERLVLPLIFINIVVLIVYVFFKPEDLEIEYINIANQTNVKITETIVIQFNKNFSEEFVNTCQFTTTPESELTTEINNFKIVLIVNPHWNYNTSYSLSINCDEINENITFQTNSYEEASENEIITEQIAKDKEIADSIKKLYEEQPWREQLPIETEKLVITYSQTLDTYLIENLTNTPNEELEDMVRLELQKIEAPDNISLTWRK